MNKEINKIEENEVMNEEEIVETETKQKFGAKVGGWVKKNGKKIVTGVAVVAVGALGYVLGKKTVGEGCECECFEDDELEFVEDDSVEVDPE